MSISGYDHTQRDVATGRQLESRVLLRSAMRLQECIESTNLEQLFEAVSLNNKLWLLFYSEIESGRSNLPKEIEQNIIKLVAYILNAAPLAFSRDKSTLETLVSINRRIGASLATNPGETEEQVPVAPQGISTKA